MYIVHDSNNDLEQLRSKYLLLTLDTLEINEELITSYVVIDTDKLQMQDLIEIGDYQDLHEGLILNYKNRMWDDCLESLRLLTGSFKGEVDSFYIDIGERINALKDIELPTEWTGNIQLSGIQ